MIIIDVDNKKLYGTREDFSDIRRYFIASVYDEILYREKLTEEEQPMSEEYDFIKEQPMIDNKFISLRKEIVDFLTKFRYVHSMEIKGHKTSGFDIYKVIHSNLIEVPYDILISNDDDAIVDWIDSELLINIRRLDQLIVFFEKHPEVDLTYLANKYEKLVKVLKESL